MKHLAVLYTNNSIDDRVIKTVLSKFIEMVIHQNLIFKTLGIIVSIHPFKELLNIEGGKIKNIIAPQNIINKGHLSIMDKITFAMEYFPSDFISLHEHDVLYPKDYLFTIQELIYDAYIDFDYIAYNNIIGANKTGYLQRTIHDYPLSTLIFKSSVIKELFSNKRLEYFSNGNWCYLEPGYGGSYGSELRRMQLGKGSVQPAIHINMDQTKQNHHFTNHYLTYESVSKTGFNYWPGGLSFMFE